MSQSTSVAPPLSLNKRLDEIENHLGRLSINEEMDVFAIFQELDEVKQQLDDGEKRGLALKAEQAQWDGILATIKRDAGELLRKAGGKSSLQSARNQKGVPPDHWWWYLDEYLAEERRKRFYHILRLGIILGAVLALVVILYQKFFAPDPKVIAEVTAKQNAEQALMEKDIQAALKEVEEGLKQSPESMDLLMLKAGILEAQGKTNEAKALFTELEKRAKNPEAFALSKAQTYMLLNRLGEAIDVLNGLIAQEPDSAKGYLLLGQAYELMGDQLQALQTYEKASEVGERVNDPTTVAQARIKMGMLMQIMGLPTLDQAAPTNTP
ncbi:protein containing TPR repeat [Anaerolinea thermolimosa]|uniref:tetratricopeptide repeat protein n=1 Tax=Anaerolinea thermolimosa TaxID=229919 RepID=UPI000782B7FB|nr:tetratricopeptide repeat protein [Anaerolinea thermolimosa]GAP06593.1 protein containing TPR repeat [Anaerolinea thermolimosa]